LRPHLNVGVGVADGAAVVGGDVGDAALAKLHAPHLAELVRPLLLADAVNHKAALAVVYQAEVLVCKQAGRQMHTTHVRHWLQQMAQAVQPSHTLAHGFSASWVTGEGSDARRSPRKLSCPAIITTARKRTGLGDPDHIHEANGVSLVGANLVVHLHQPLHENAGHLLSGQGIPGKCK